MGLKEKMRPSSWSKVELHDPADPVRLEVSEVEESTYVRFVASSLRRIPMKIWGVLTQGNAILNEMIYLTVEH